MQQHEYVLDRLARIHEVRHAPRSGELPPPTLRVLPRGRRDKPLCWAQTAEPENEEVEDEEEEDDSDLDSEIAEADADANADDPRDVDGFAEAMMEPEENREDELAQGVTSRGPSARLLEAASATKALPFESPATTKPSDLKKTPKPSGAKTATKAGAKRTKPPGNSLPPPPTHRAPTSL